MAKRKINLCIYCGAIAETRDHTPSKILLEKPYPQNLITVPSCLECNCSFSLDEEYFLHVLVEIATSEALLSKLESNGTVHKARERSLDLTLRLKNSLVEGNDGRIYIQPEFNRLKRVIEKIALGLYYNRYKRGVKLKSVSLLEIYPYNIIETRPSEIILLTYNEHFFPKKWTIIQKGIFSYIIVKDWRKSSLSMILQIHDTIWCIVDVPFPKAISRVPKNQLYLFDINSI